MTSKNLSFARMLVCYLTFVLVLVCHGRPTNGVESDGQRYWDSLVIDRYDRHVLPCQSIRCSVTVTTGPGISYEKAVDPVQRLAFFRKPLPNEVGDQREFVQILPSEIATNVRYMIMPAGTSQQISESPATQRLINGFRMRLCAPISATCVGMTSVRGVFENVGEIELRVTEGNAVPGNDSATSMLVHVVLPTSKEDLEALAEIRRSRDLELSVINPLVAYESDILPMLKDLVQRFPKSSYSNYWRLAIAARILGDRGRFLSEEYREYSTEILRLIQSDKPRDAYRFLKFQPNRAKAPIEMAITAAISASNDSEQHQRITADSLASFMRANADDRKEAVKYLSEIDSADFAHFPSVLILLRKFYLVDDPKKAEELKIRLNKEYSASFEWLRELQLSNEDWQSLRVLKSRW